MNIFQGGSEEGLFKAFCAAETNRRRFLEALLKARGIPFSMVRLASREHIIVRFEGDAYNPFFRMKTLVAHYDRSENNYGLPSSPGANDNSAACFQLVSLAERILEKKDHNVLIVFSEGEEAGKNGVRFQGAYALALGLKKLKKLHFVESDIFVFDACGRGDTLILSSSSIDTTQESHHAKKDASFVQKREELYKRARALAQKSCQNSFLTLPTPYSDNAGFFAAGIPAQLITVLPHEEAAKLMEETAVLGHEKLLRVLASYKRAEKSESAAAIPQTWKDMHTKRDAPSTLTPEAFALMERFLDALALEKMPSEGG